MSSQLPIGPLQIVINYSNAGTTEISTGTIVVNSNAQAGTNASVVLTIKTLLIQAPGAPVVTRAVNSTQTLPAVWTPATGGIDANWSVQSGGATTHFRFSGNFGNNLQGNGSYTTTTTGAGISQQTWTAQLGETNVPFYLNHSLVGDITIAGSAVTFNFTSGGSPVVAAVNPQTGAVSSTAASGCVITGTFLSNMTASGSVSGLSRLRQSGGNANWGTEVSS